MKFLLFLSTVDCYRRTPYKEELLKIGNKFQIRDRVEFEGISCDKKETKDRYFIFLSILKFPINVVRKVTALEFIHKNNKSSKLFGTKI